MKIVRIKFILEDGRKVYASKHGVITAVPLDNAMKLFEKPSEFGYTKSLNAFGPITILEQEKMPFVRVVSIELEENEAPIDASALLAGGTKAVP